MRKPPSLEWSWGLLVGVLAGFAVVMVAVDTAAQAAPGLLARGFRVPIWAAVACLAGATLLMQARNQASGRGPGPHGSPAGDAG